MTLFEQINRWPAQRVWLVRWRSRTDSTARVRAKSTTDTGANVRSAAVAMVVAFALVIVFGSAGMRHFARDLPGNEVTDLLVAGADQWHELMLELGPARVQPAVRAAFAHIRAADWPCVGDHCHSAEQSPD